MRLLIFLVIRDQNKTFKKISCTSIEDSLLENSLLFSSKFIGISTKCQNLWMWFGWLCVTIGVETFYLVVILVFMLYTMVLKWIKSEMVGSGGGTLLSGITQLFSFHATTAAPKKTIFAMHTHISSRYNIWSLTLTSKVTGGHWRSLEVKRGSMQKNRLIILLARNLPYILM